MNKKIPRRYGRSPFVRFVVHTYIHTYILVLGLTKSVGGGKRRTKLEIDPKAGDSTTTNDPTTHGHTHWTDPRDGRASKEYESRLI